MEIEHYSFGRMIIDGKTYTSDLKIIAGKIHPNWWRKMGHTLQIEDIQDVIEAKPSVLVVGLGASGVMRLAPGVREELAQKGIECIAHPTGRATSIFNELFSQSGPQKVAGAFHLTC